MKFSEAIRLGSLTMKPMANTRQDMDNPEYGCAIGMAELAIGKKTLTKFSCNHKGDAETEWPWASWEHGRNLPIPCGCIVFYTYATALVAHIFNEHVMGDKTWTLDKLCEWVASVEPKETTPAEPEKEVIEETEHESVRY